MYVARVAGALWRRAAARHKTNDRMATSTLSTREFLFLVGCVNMMTAMGVLHATNTDVVERVAGHLAAQGHELERNTVSRAKGYAEYRAIASAVWRVFWDFKKDHLFRIKDVLAIRPYLTCTAEDALVAFRAVGVVDARLDFTKTTTTAALVRENSFAARANKIVAHAFPTDPSTSFWFSTRDGVVDKVLKRRAPLAELMRGPPAAGMSWIHCMLLSMPHDIQVSAAKEYAKRCGFDEPADVAYNTGRPRIWWRGYWVPDFGSIDDDEFERDIGLDWQYEKTEVVASRQCEDIEAMTSRL